MEQLYKEVLNQNVSRETFLKIEEYIDFLLVWNQKIALISKKNSREVIYKHIIDVIFFFQLYEIENDKDLVVDVGSGNGLVGVILSILGIKNIELVEIKYKKTIFLQELKRKLKLNYKVYNDDVKHYKHIKNRNIHYISKAFSNIKTFIDLVHKDDQNLETLWIYKYEDQIQKEVDESKNFWNFNYKLFHNPFYNKSVILKINNIYKKCIP